MRGHAVRALAHPAEQPANWQEPPRVCGLVCEVRGTVSRRHRHSSWICSRMRLRRSLSTADFGRYQGEFLASPVSLCIGVNTASRLYLCSRPNCPSSRRGPQGLSAVSPSTLITAGTLAAPYLLEATHPALSWAQITRPCRPAGAPGAAPSPALLLRPPSPSWTCLMTCWRAAWLPYSSRSGEHCGRQGRGFKHVVLVSLAWPALPGWSGCTDLSVRLSAPCLV